jgi:CRISPR-associated endonuclease/helicase Cas3
MTTALDTAVALHDLDAGDFDAFFLAVHGVAPFPWQSRLARRVLTERCWPDQLDLPTATGKTAAIDIAVFHLAAEARLGADRRAPVRIAFVVDRRLIVDDAHARAEVLARALADPNAPEPVRKVAAALAKLASPPTVGQNARPLIVQRMRGGVPREDDWARTPSQPTVLTSTVDQVGSRLLFRGYGLRPTMAPIHAGLLGADCLILLDEAHLSRPFEQTLAAIERLGHGAQAPSRPMRWAVLTATPANAATRPFALDDDDSAHPVLHARLALAKPTVLTTIKSGKGDNPGDENDRAADTARRAAADRERVAAILEHIHLARAHFATRESGLNGAAPVIGVVVNRVLRARMIYDALTKSLAELTENPDGVTLVIGPARGVEREYLAELDLAPLRTGRTEARAALGGPRIVVATQTIEAGVDLDFDALITEVAALDALRQRFGRLNRAGRPIVPYAAIIANAREDLRLKGDGDPLYGHAAKATWERLVAWLGEAGLDFAHNAMAPRLASLSATERDAMLTPKAKAPTVMPAYVDLWSQTAPVPKADPDVALFLHGPSRNQPRVRIAWRADLTRETMDNAGSVLEVAPPRASETVDVSLFAARAWLGALAAEHRYRTEQVDFSDAPERENALGVRTRNPWPAFSVAREEVVSRPDQIRPNDLIIVPASYGGCDRFGWSPYSDKPVTDVGEWAAWPYRARRYAARLTQARLEAAILAGAGNPDAEPDRETLRRAAATQWASLATRVSELSGEPLEQLLAILDADLPAEIGDLFKPLKFARADRIDVMTPYADDDDVAPYLRGFVLSARFGLTAKATLARPGAGAANLDEVTPDGAPTTEDDKIGSMNRRDVGLVTHSCDVREQANLFAEHCGLSPALVKDLSLAGWLHDAGKADPRFQALLGSGDPLFLEERAILGKSGRRSARGDWERAGLPENWRHEALSVRLALINPRLGEAHDPALVVWLVGTHHGRGRPFFPHLDPRDTTGHPALPLIEHLVQPLGAGKGPQSPGFTFDSVHAPDLAGLDWTQMFDVLKRRYGVWGLAHMEAILRLADHRASQRRDLDLAETES